MLQSFLNRLVQHPILRRDHVFHRFLTGDASWVCMIFIAFWNFFFDFYDSLFRWSEVCRFPWVCRFVGPAFVCPVPLVAVHWLFWSLDWIALNCPQLGSFLASLLLRLTSSNSVLSATHLCFLPFRESSFKTLHF